MKKYFLIPFLLISSLYAYPRCSAELAPALHAVYHFPEGKKLIAQAEAEGPIRIFRAPFNSKSHAMWVAEDRAIIINANNFRSFGEIIRSIFFELHNAKTSSQFDALDWHARNRQISKSEYVKSVEHIEYQNAYTASRLIERAIGSGYFPPDSRWPIAADFNTHFRIQQKAGHSEKIAGIYDSISRSCYYGRRH